MGKRRRQFRELEVLEVLIVHQHVAIPCFRCGAAFTEEDVRTGNIEKEHLHERALEGPDEPFNCRFSHKAAPCHHTVTNGTPATTAGSSKQRIAKTTATRADKFLVDKPALDQPREKGSRWHRRTSNTKEISK